MTNMLNPGDPLPLALRIGITGSRHLAPDQLPRIRAEIAKFLRSVREEVSRLALTAEAKAAYGGADGAPIVPQLLVLSPLAEGADRLLSEIALDQGFSLACPLPFERSEYEKDFGSDDSKREFRTLLDRAGPAVLELDGARGDAQDRSYEAVGRYVVRNCDILVAIWNGQPGKGFGGTTDIIRFAINHGPPVWWIRTDGDGEPAWLVDGQDFRNPVKERFSLEAPLQAYLSRLILPPSETEPHAATWFERAARMKILQHGDAPAYLDYRKPVPTPESWIWKAYGWLMNAVGGAAPAPPTSPPEPPEPAARYWFHHYSPADGWASAFARRYRSTYVWVFALATVAVTFASIALVVPKEIPIKLAVTGLELVALLLIAAAVLTNERKNWHQRFLGHRLLAELCRKQQALALFGSALQGPSATEKSIAFRSRASSQESNWVSWLFGALQRAAPVLQGRFDADRTRLARDEVVHDLIDDQLHYHRIRASQSERVGKRLGQLGEWFFIAVLAFVIIKLVLVAMHIEPRLVLALGLAAAILPAIAAGFVGIRSYTELALLADQSNRMLAEMEAARARLLQIDVTEPLASQILGSEISDVAAIMLQDIQGWLQLFRAKVVEPG